MEQMTDLKSLLMHDTQLLLSVEEQIIDALPLMMEKAQSDDLKRALNEHLQVTRGHRDRINNIRPHLGISEENVSSYTGVLANLMGNADTCKGMQGLIAEGQKVMAENLAPEVMDAAIIGCCQKIEHFEIAAYGTARTYAEQLGLLEVATLLETTLQEEYAADQTLTTLAVGKINVRAAAGA
jgi:ferritin-like metal-binding protein YciE